MVSASEDMFKRLADKLKYEVRLLGSREYRTYEFEDDRIFAPFMSQERLEIAMLAIKDSFDIDAYLHSGVIQSIFAVHDAPELRVVKRRWLSKCCSCHQPFSTVNDYVHESESCGFEPLSAIKSYMGEEIAFYYAWFCHYTSYLMYAAPLGISHSLQIVNQDLNSPLLPFSAS